MRTVIIGAGISGLTAALMAKEAGADVTVITVGFGGLQLGQGTLDIFDAPEPLNAIAALPENHPYRTITPESINEGVSAFRKIVPLDGSVEESTVFPTALGSLRRTGLYPHSMAAGRIEDGASYLLVGFSGLKDFYPALAAENLANQGVNARSHTVTLTAQGDTALAFSRSLALPGAAEDLGRALAQAAREGERIGIPAVVHEADFERIRQAAGHPVFQIPLPPPSIPGLEMNELARQACAEARIRMHLNSKAVGFTAADGRISAVKVQVAGSVKVIPADHVVYAGGGIESGAILLDSHRVLSETVFGLPVFAEEEILNGDYWGSQQPLFAAGLKVDSAMRPVDTEGKPVFENLHAVGGLLSGAQRAHEKSGEGIALGSAAQAINAILRSDS
ncbi:glycerol-3-phosphate dehydrogenase subunit GlpB [Changpingibacter yushuensis]|uniref:glycerol-3-phosphate dehydrogenase subunit GlpB n=1 Tax=Changpingibacter yushuensis TaxID=2758440 RepID=UPI00165E30B5|nr:glycerol-3-phosphate dehydrogenase subunit GlpB [Changpingibacter yushuensis]